jgi:hypothetical protein
MQSIVDQPSVSGGPVPTFSYTATAMSGWLCRSIKGGYTQAQCAANYDPDLCPNNSSPQGEIFYAQIGQSNSPPHYDVYAVDSCGGPEGSASKSSNVPGYNPSQNPNGISGFNAVTQDMTLQCTHPH